MVIPLSESLPGWLAVTYGAVGASMAVDFVTGVRKARRAGRATTSRGYKMTCGKAAKYFLPMLCLTCVDLITQAVLPVPVFTMGMGAFNILCEWKSVLESTHDKEEIRRASSTVRAVIENRDDLARAISEILKKEIDNEKD